MIKIELGRKSPEWTTPPRYTLRGVSKSPERNVEKSGLRSVPRSPVQMQNSVPNGACKIDENKKPIGASGGSDTHAVGIFNKSGAKTFARESSPGPREKSKITEGKNDSTATRKERNRSPQCSSEVSNNVKDESTIDVKCGKVTPRSVSPPSFFEKMKPAHSKSPPRSLSPQEKSEVIASKNISLKRLDKPASPRSSSPKSNNYYPRRKSEFEKSRIFRKLQEELDRDSPEDLQKSSEDRFRTFRKEKSPSPPKYNESFFRIKDYPRRTSEFEKSDTFSKLRSSLDEDEKKMSRGRRRSATPPVVKSSYENIKDSSKRKTSKTTFHKLQEDFDGSSPERKSSPSNTYDDYSKDGKSEAEKSAIFRKLQMELSSSPEPTDQDTKSYKHHSPTRISLTNNELEISNSFAKARAHFETLKSVELLKDAILSQKTHESTIKNTLTDVDNDVTNKESVDSIPHKIVKKDKPKETTVKVKRSQNDLKTSTTSSVEAKKGSPNESFSSVLIRECSPVIVLNSEGRSEKGSRYLRTDSVESALGKFSSIDNVTIENSSAKVGKPNSESRRSRLHAATASWTMKTRANNQHIHENASTPAKTAKLHDRSRSRNLKASKRVITKELPRSPTSPTLSISPPSSCKKRLFTDSESDVASEDTRGSARTITIETFKRASPEIALQQPLKILRSIEDIRGSMTRDKFMETIDKPDNLISPKVTIRIISPNTARRIGYINQYVEFGVSKSGDCSEINVKPARRIEKMTSPDDPRRRIGSNEARNVSRHNSDISLRVSY